MSFEDNEVYYNNVRVVSADALPQDVAIQFSSRSRQNVVRLHDVGGSGRVSIDLRQAVGCKVLIGSGNTVVSGALNITFPMNAGRPTAGAFVVIGHANSFTGGASIQAPFTAGQGITIGSRNLIAPGLSVRGSNHAVFDLATGLQSNSEVGSTIGSRNWLGNGVNVFNRGGIGNDSVVALGAIVNKDWSATGNVALAGMPARVVSEGIAWTREMYYSTLEDVPSPDLTIGITTYERPLSLRRALDSVLSQKLPAGSQVEVLVVDDGSDSASFKELWAALGDLPRTKGFTVQGLCNPEPTGGPSAGRNSVIDVARGSHVMFLDDDDQLAEGALTPLLEYIASSTAQRTSLRYRRAGRSILLAPAMRHERLDIVDSLWTMLPPSIYRTSDIRGYRSKFPEGVHYGEDNEFVLHFSVRAENFTALCDRDYVIIGDPVAGEGAHLSQGKGSWEEFLRGVISHLDRLAKIIDGADIPAYVRDRLAAKCLIGRGITSYELARRLGDMDDSDLAADLLSAYSGIINDSIPEAAILRFARENSLEREIAAVVGNDLDALRAARAYTGAAS
ncbi:glycosyltransferase [Promicromonospora sp. NPDC057488]|uniref:glycosyltransferase n=1 Tax=Promicromonospora sp. NPDC057488 TaxID=3346147 RepID=UPI0036725AB3